MEQQSRSKAIQICFTENPAKDFKYIFNALQYFSCGSEEYNDDEDREFLSDYLSGNFNSECKDAILGYSVGYVVCKITKYYWQLYRFHLVYIYSSQSCKCFNASLFIEYLNKVRYLVLVPASMH